MRLEHLPKLKQMEDVSSKSELFVTLSFPWERFLAYLSYSAIETELLVQDYFLLQVKKL